MAHAAATAVAAPRPWPCRCDRAPTADRHGGRALVAATSPRGTVGRSWLRSKGDDARLVVFLQTHLLASKGWQDARKKLALQTNDGRADEQIRKYERNMRGNRGMMLKIFGVLAFFVVVYGTLL